METWNETVVLVFCSPGGGSRRWFFLFSLSRGNQTHFYHKKYNRLPSGPFISKYGRFDRRILWESVTKIPFVSTEILRTLSHNYFSQIWNYLEPQIVGLPHRSFFFVCVGAEKNLSFFFFCFSLSCRSSSFPLFVIFSLLVGGFEEERDGGFEE